MNLFVIYDPLAKQASPVFEAKTPAVASRQFAKIKANDKDPAAKDYRLYLIGNFDEETMALSPEDPPIEIVAPALPIQDEGQLEFDLINERR